MRIKSRYRARMRGRSNSEMVSKVGGRVEAGKPDKGSG